MSINGKYESYESNTFTIQLSMDDLTDLDMLFHYQLNPKNLGFKPREQAQKFMDMIHQAVKGAEFGFDYYHIDK